MAFAIRFRPICARYGKPLRRRKNRQLTPVVASQGEQNPRTEVMVLTDHARRRFVQPHSRYVVCPVLLFAIVLIAAGWSLFALALKVASAAEPQVETLSR